jgi:hypothetical protein
MAGGRGPLYCRPEHADGRLIDWGELVQNGAVVYGGVGVNRYVLDYDHPERRPFADIFRVPRDFSFFLPTEADLHIPHGMILNSGRSSMSSDRKGIQFATASFNSGKSTCRTTIHAISRRCWRRSSVLSKATAFALPGAARAPRSNCRR